MGDYDLKPNDLSRILDVSTNTIRRYDEKGYFGTYREEENAYRKFSNADVEKLMEIGKYRKIGFSHKEIGEIFGQDMEQTIRQFKERKAQLDARIEELQAYSHMLLDDIRMMERAEKFRSQFMEMDCAPMHYVLYMKKGSLCTDEKQLAAFHHFMSSCPEFKYLYHFEREDVLAGRLVWNEGIVANQLFTSKYEVEITEGVEIYERRPCVMQFVRVPARMSNTDTALRRILYDTLLDHLREKGYELKGDVVGIKVGFSREEEQDWQYILLSFPVGE